MKKILLAALLVLVGATLLVFRDYAPKRSLGHRTVAQVLAEYERPVRERLKLDAWPRQLALVGLKQERILEVWWRDGDRWALLKRYPVLAASGVAGPKLREGDRQVPEGVYRIGGLNPSSRFHLSLKVNYPNEEDRRLALTGGEIFVHGSALSVGCLAVGNVAIEEIFVLAARAESLPAIFLAPRDFRKRPPGPSDIVDKPPWIARRYADLARQLRLLTEETVSIPDRVATPGSAQY